MSTVENKAQISAFIVCMNEEGKIRRALESIKWCDEIVVIDSGSTDKTLDICREYTDKIFSRPWPGYVAQKSFGLSQCSKEWVLNLDADEEVSSDLKGEIQELLKNDDRSINGFLLSRVVFFLGKWWRSGGWYPEFRLRLCRRSETTWGGSDPHEKAIVSGKTKRLRGELHHYTYTDIAHQIRTLNSYSSQAAESLFNNGKSAGVLQILSRPLVRFFKWYFLKQGFREGFPGFIVAVLESYYVFLKYVKLWEIGKRE